MESDILYSANKKLVDAQVHCKKINALKIILYLVAFFLILWNYLPMTGLVPGLISVPLGTLSFFLIPVPVLIIAIYLSYRSRRSAKKIKAMRSLN